MCLVGPPGPLRSKMGVMTHVVNFYLKNTLSTCAVISEENNSQMFSYMINFLVCVWKS